MGVLNIDFNNINLYHNFDKGDPNTIILIKLLPWFIKFEKGKALIKNISEELISVTWHPKRWCNFSMSEDKKKEIELIFTKGCQKYASVVYDMGVLKHFVVLDIETL